MPGKEQHNKTYEPPALRKGGKPLRMDFCTLAFYRAGPTWLEAATQLQGPSALSTLSRHHCFIFIIDLLTSELSYHPLPPEVLLRSSLHPLPRLILVRSELAEAAQCHTTVYSDTNPVSCKS